MKYLETLEKSQDKIAEILKIDIYIQ